MNLWRCNGHASQKWKRPAVEVKGPKPGYYKVETTGVHAGHSAAQPAGWGLSAWGAHGAVRNHASSWAAVHSGNHWPMVWKIEKSKRTNGEVNAANASTRKHLLAFTRYLTSQSRDQYLRPACHMAK